MSPVLLRLLMVFAAVACLVAAHFFPAQAAALIPLATGLLGWAKAAPGHGDPYGAQSSQGGFVGLRTLLLAAGFALLVFACAALRQIDPHTAARKGLQEAAKLFDADRKAVQAGDLPSDKYVEDACSLLLSPTVEAEPPRGTGGA